MKLWFISQDENSRYNTFSDAVVAAETKEEARATHPGGSVETPGSLANDWNGRKEYGSWVNSPNRVHAKLIGEAVPGTEPGVICYSYHAG